MIGALTKIFGAQRKAVNDVWAVLDTVRNKITMLRDEREQVQQWLLPIEEAGAQIDRWLDELLQNGFPPIGGLATDTPGLWPILSDRQTGSAALALVVAASREAVRKVLVEKVAVQYRHQGSGSPAEKKRRLEEIDADLAELERQEEKIIREAEAAGLPILRRENASPAVVLAADEDL